MLFLKLQQIPASGEGEREGGEGRGRGREGREEKGKWGENGCTLMIQ